ncbi:unnamed protein product [Adineta ricciae]|uniref:Uncharacterized protein n=1 Tax=Adineta ricciae TaxID=249248 RepID=A0A814ETJ7_ADIRI|nr:unnamed protein product [Adineta ricciae]CAF0973749.1 unnamed protein product [Adineta ricciae]
MTSDTPAVAINHSEKDDPFALDIDSDNRCYNVFDLNTKCSTDALKTFHRCCDAILERDPELFDIWIDDHRFYSHGIVEVIENELSSLHHKCLFSNLKPLQGFRWLEGLFLVIGSYLKYLQEFDDRDRLDALLNLFYAAWITFFIHNRYAILQLSCPSPPPDANNNNDDCIVVDNQEKRISNPVVHKSEEQIVRHLEKHLPNFDRILYEVIELGHQLASKRLPNLAKFEEFYNVWRNPSGNKHKSTGDFSLIIERITGEIDFTYDPNDMNYSATKAINWKMVFYDEFLRYADRFYVMKKSLPSKRRTIGGERFSINKWSSNKINYFLTKNIFKRNRNNEYENQIEQLYH